MENKTNSSQEDRVSHACGQKYILKKTQFDGKKPSALSLLMSASSQEKISIYLQ